jgi:predicted kinase
VIVLFGGSAGSGKTTVARLWCKRQPRAVHLELDSIRDLIVSGQVDPQIFNEDQAHQYEANARACSAVAKSFDEDGFAVAVDDVFEPEVTRMVWGPELVGLDVRIVILHPALSIAISRGIARSKRVEEHHIRAQHEAVGQWPKGIRVDSSALDPSQTIAAAFRVLETANLVDFIS